MDAWIRNIMKSMAFASSGSSRESSFEPEILLCKRSRARTSSATTVLSAASLSSASTSASSRSYEIQQANNSNNSSTNSSQCHKASESRIANWDKKREKCRNCALIYLKTLSRHPGFCSVDCKSNAAYLEKVNRTIRAMKDAVEQRQQQQHEAVKAAAAQETAPAVAVRAPQPQAVEEPVQDEDVDDDEDDNSGRTPQAAHTFSEFGLESRILDASNVEWAFSALY